LPCCATRPHAQAHSGSEKWQQEPTRLATPFQPSRQRVHAHLSTYSTGTCCALGLRYLALVQHSPAATASGATPKPGSHGSPCTHASAGPAHRLAVPRRPSGHARQRQRAPSGRATLQLDGLHATQLPPLSALVGRLSSLLGINTRLPQTWPCGPPAVQQRHGLARRCCHALALPHLSASRHLFGSRKHLPHAGPWPEGQTRLRGSAFKAPCWRGRLAGTRLRGRLAV